MYVTPAAFAGSSHSGFTLFLKNDQEVMRRPPMATIRVGRRHEAGCVWFHMRPKSENEDTVQIVVYADAYDSEVAIPWP